MCSCIGHLSSCFLPWLQGKVCFKGVESLSSLGVPTLSGVACRTFAEGLGKQLGLSLEELQGPEAEHLLEQDPEARRKWRELQQQRVAIEASSASPAPAAASEESSSASSSSSSSAALVLAQFDPKSASILLEEEIREAVIGTAGTALGRLKACLVLHFHSSEVRAW